MLLSVHFVAVPDSSVVMLNLWTSACLTHTPGTLSAGETGMLAYRISPVVELSDHTVGISWLDIMNQAALDLISSKKLP
jgi:hypothetical protein